MKKYKNCLHICKTCKNWLRDKGSKTGLGLCLKLTKLWDTDIKTYEGKLILDKHNEKLCWEKKKKI